MSRGPGRWQRLLLDALEQRDTVIVADAVEASLGREPTRSELVAARRAAWALSLNRLDTHPTRVWLRDTWGRPHPYLALTRDQKRIDADLARWLLSVVQPQGNAYREAL